MVCPDCDTDLPDKVGHSTCPQCNTHLLNTEKGVRAIEQPRIHLPKGEPALVNGKLTRVSKTERSSHPNQPIYMMNNIMYMDCIGCNLPIPYLDMVKGKIWD